jgi:DNA-binding NtrC family response regulator
VVEPDKLTRWSVTNYFGRWFHVLAADTLASAMRILDETNIDALVFSEDLPDQTAEALLTLAKQRNRRLRTVCTVTDRTRAELCRNRTACVEKPFDLSKLAKLLEVEAGCGHDLEGDSPGCSSKTT